MSEEFISLVTGVLIFVTLTEVITLKFSYGIRNFISLPRVVLKGGVIGCWLHTSHTVERVAIAHAAVKHMVEVIFIALLLLGFTTIKPSLGGCCKNLYKCTEF